MKQFSLFVRNESGSTSVEWIILTAMILGISVAIFSSLANSIDRTANVVSTDIALVASYAQNSPTVISPDACDEETLCDRYGAMQ
ncbi:MAG: hypothetical protein V3V13_12595 [Paracoccaceae bacterium]